MRKNTIENLKRQILMIKWYFSDSQINIIGFLVLKTWWMHFWNLIFMVISDFYENLQIFMAQQHELFFWKFGENADCVNLLVCRDNSEICSFVTLLLHRWHFGESMKPKIWLNNNRFSHFSLALPGSSHQASLSI